MIRVLADEKVAVCDPDQTLEEGASWPTVPFERLGEVFPHRLSRCAKCVRTQSPLFDDRVRSEAPMGSQCLESLRHVCGEWGGQIELGLGDGMTKPQPMSVEGLSLDQRDIARLGGESPILRAEQLVQRHAVATRVQFVREDRVADVGEVHADLVGPPALGLAAHQAKPRKRSSTS